MDNYGKKVQYSLFLHSKAYGAAAASGAQVGHSPAGKKKGQAGA
jgi:hypothetical protein